MDKTAGRFSFDEWYRQNKDAWNKRRRTRYHTDREYRERVLAGNRRSKRNRKPADGSI